jgi:hypothetical protein
MYLSPNSTNESDCTTDNGITFYARRDVFVPRVCCFQRPLSFLRSKPFDRVSAVDHCNDDVTVFRLSLPVNHDEIAAENVRALHAVSRDLNSEYVIG